MQKNKRHSDEYTSLKAGELTFTGGCWPLLTIYRRSQPGILHTTCTRIGL